MLHFPPALARMARRVPGFGTLNSARGRVEDRLARTFARGSSGRSDNASELNSRRSSSEYKNRDDAAAYPLEFDPAVYRRYPDIAAMSDKELRLHYQQYGLAEGRVASAGCRREDFIALASSANAVLEIGPFSSPAIRKKGVKYFDVLDQDELRKRAVVHQQDPAGCPAIDYVSPVGDLSVVDETFDVILSSHAIEHQPDLIKHLQQVEKLLRPGGAYFLLIPDKRFCFDHFLPETALSEVLAAHYEKRERHTLQCVIEHVALTTHNDVIRHWSGGHGERLTSGTRERIDSIVRHCQENADSYIDVHAWQFTPASFRAIMTDLHFLDYTALFPARVYDTPCGRLEFTAILNTRT